MKAKDNGTPAIIEDIGFMYATKNSKKKTHYLLAECSNCGNEYRIIKDNLKDIKSSLCRKCKGIKHEGVGSRLYNIYCGMKSRCSKNGKYGKIGIFICDEWKNNFSLFEKWANDNGYKDNLTIDRIKNNKGYSPDNCRWTTQTIQNRNIRVLRSTNTSGFKGVSSLKNGRYRTQIVHDRKLIYLGQYDNALDAGIAYNNYVIKNSLEHTINPIDAGRD